MSHLKVDNRCALVLGGHVNGYCIAKELHEQGIHDIALFDTGRSLARYSNKIKYRAVIDDSPERLLLELKKLHVWYGYIVIFPTDDQQLVNLNVIYNEVVGFCYLPFNHQNILHSLDKIFQYQICEKIGIPYPKSVGVKTASDLDAVDKLTFPVLVKPSTRQDLTSDVFRNAYFETKLNFFAEKKLLADMVSGGIEFVVSEYIPGDDANIFAYTCFRSHDGKILNEWVGRKLAQYPDNFGVFSSASTESSADVLVLGRHLVTALNAYGIVEPEFKYDARNKEYKLIEANLRSMMWHRAGSVSGVKLQETQYRYAIGQEIISYKQAVDRRLHFVLMLHEIPNLIARKGYWKTFKYNILGGDRLYWAVFEWRDVKPFLYGLFLLTKAGIAVCLKRFGLR